MRRLADILTPGHFLLLAIIVAPIWWWVHAARARRDRQQREIGYLRGRVEELERKRDGQP